MAVWEEQGENYFRSVIGPLLLMTITPFLPFIFLQTYEHHDRSLSSFFSTFFSLDGIHQFYTRLPHPTWYGFRVVATFIIVEYLLLRFLPGKDYDGPLTEQGHRPRYKGNAVLSFVITHSMIASLLYSDYIDGAAIFDALPAIYAMMVPAGLLLCLVLYLQGVARPDGPDIYISNNVVWDYYKGVQLHPRFAGVDLKQLINCRVAMMAWGVLLLVYCDKQYALVGQVKNGLITSVALQLIYIFKFFLWERGYTYSIDIIHDRAGYMIIWGVLCFLPVVYTNHSYYLVGEKDDISNIRAVAIFAFGVVSIYLNYWADKQRQESRDNDGVVVEWATPWFLGGRGGESNEKDFIRAIYKTDDGKQHKTLLLASGFWGMARHFNYVFELMLALSFGLPVADGFNFLPFFYFFFLVILLFDRAHRDDHRCQQKYGKYWTDYKKIVPYSVIPGIY